MYIKYAETERQKLFGMNQNVMLRADDSDKRFCFYCSFRDKPGLVVSHLVALVGRVI